jgi:hypothetical protein
MVVSMGMQFSLIVQHQEMHFIKHLHILSLNENKIFYAKMHCIWFYNKDALHLIL